jgi:DNA-directed RNA polymerase subunit RPC12/RpoP/biotin transporter BioY
MDIKKAECASCGAPLQILPNVEHVSCTYCGAQMTVERGKDYLALKAAEEVGSKLQDVGDRTQEAIRESTLATQAQLKQLQLSQSLSAAQMQLASTQSEIRSLERQKQDRKIRQQLRDLRDQEMALRQRVRNLQAATTPSVAPSGMQRWAGVREDARAAATHSPKDWMTTMVLCLLLGLFGVHRFYSGHTLIGFAQLFTSGGFFLWWLIDLGLILSGRYRDSKGFLLENRNPAMASGCGWALGVFFVIFFFGVLITRSIDSESIPFAVTSVALVAGAVVFALRYTCARKEEKH